jgi:hypothetical protein
MDGYVEGDLDRNQEERVVLKCRLHIPHNKLRGIYIGCFHGADLFLRVNKRSANKENSLCFMESEDSVPSSKSLPMDDDLS